MIKVDYKKEYKDLYTAKEGVVKELEVPAFNYISVEGKGNPNTSSEFTEAIEALYGTAYTMKFTMKSEIEKDFVVMPLQGLWWSDNMNDFADANKHNWQWKVMILMPDFVNAEWVEKSKKIISDKKDLPGLKKLKFEKFKEGKSLQIMHIGPYDKEKETIEIIHNYMKEKGLEFNHPHHEIYLSDPRRTAPEKLKTIIRQSVK